MPVDISGKVLAIVLAGGPGTRLHPLTQYNPKASLIVGGYRLVDFALGNLVNSGIDSIYVLAQYLPDSLVEHVHANWTFASNGEERFVRVAVAPPGDSTGAAQGAAISLARNLDLIERHEPDLVAVFSANQVCRMDVRQMVDFHRAHNADVTVAVSCLPYELASPLIAVDVGENGKIRDFPAMQQASHRGGGYCVSTENYLFRPEVLVKSLEHLLWCGETSFSRHLLPRLARTHRVCAYDFSNNRVPGIRPYEEAGYWRCIKTLEDYVDVLEDIGGDRPLFRLRNPEWPIMPPLSAQRPLFDASYAQLLVVHKRREFESMTFNLEG